MSVPLHTTCIISVHISTLAAFSHLFCCCHFAIATFSNSGSYYTVFSHYKSQKSACSASASDKTVVRQTSDRGQKIIRQWSGNHQAVVRQSIREPVHDCWSDIWPKIIWVFGSNMNLIAPFIGWKAWNVWYCKRLWVYDLLVLFQISWFLNSISIQDSHGGFSCGS